MFPTVLCAQYRNEENYMVWSDTFSRVHGIGIISRLTPDNARRTNHGVTKTVKYVYKRSTYNKRDKRGHTRTYANVFHLCTPFSHIPRQSSLIEISVNGIFGQQKRVGVFHESFPNPVAPLKFDCRITLKPVRVSRRQKRVEL